jgi:hypothetical protein
MSTHSTLLSITSSVQLALGKSVTTTHRNVKASQVIRSKLKRTLKGRLDIADLMAPPCSKMEFSWSGESISNISVTLGTSSDDNKPLILKLNMCGVCSGIMLYLLGFIMLTVKLCWRGMFLVIGTSSRYVTPSDWRSIPAGIYQIYMINVIQWCVHIYLIWFEYILLPLLVVNAFTMGWEYRYSIFNDHYLLVSLSAMHAFRTFMRTDQIITVNKYQYLFHTWKISTYLTRS